MQEALGTTRLKWHANIAISNFIIVLSQKLSKAEMDAKRLFGYIYYSLKDIRRYFKHNKNIVTTNLNAKLDEIWDKYLRNCPK